MKHLMTVEYKIETLDKKSCFLTGIVETTFDISEQSDLYQEMSQAFHRALKSHNEKIPNS